MVPDGCFYDKVLSLATRQAIIIVGRDGRKVQARNRRKQFGAIFMAIWLCSWMGLSLFHGLAHTEHPEDGVTQTCAVCHLLHQSLPATVETRLSVCPVVQYGFVLEQRAVDVALPVQFCAQSIVPRGPPTLLFT